MSCDSFEHFAERLAPRRPAEIKDSKSCGRHSVLQKGILDGLSERVDAALALAQIAQPLEDLAVVGCDHDPKRSTRKPSRGSKSYWRRWGFDDSLKTENSAP